MNFLRRSSFLGGLAVCLFVGGCGQATNGLQGDGGDGSNRDAVSDGSRLDVNADAGQDSGTGTDGGVVCGESVCGAGQSCCAATGQCYASGCLACCMPRIDAGNDTGFDGSTACNSNADCDSASYCATASCGAPGTCTSKPNVCSANNDPVCGCDGNTYQNACVAAHFGVNVASSGGCAADASADVPIMGACTNDADCNGGACCVPTGICYDPACLACCQSSADAGTDTGPGSDASCTTNADCSSTEYCAGTGCGTVGNCAPRPQICSNLYDPVCGCDGLTYGNSCLANSSGVRVASTGACGSTGDAGGVDASADAGCGVNGCGIGELCCAATGNCYSQSCLACCPTVRDAGSPDTGSGGDATSDVPAMPDAGCGVNGCGVGELCCAATGSCYAQSCLACCPVVRDAGTPDTGSGGDATSDVPAMPDAGCGVNGCGIGELCCAATGNCYSQSCLACCPIVFDAGSGDSGSGGDASTDAPVSTDAGCVVNGCATGQSCCGFTGDCYTTGCLACCMARP